ncbi:type II secretion system protein GspG [Candidatus Saccharibacteria bacterium]|nr:type II secretion system protein GspG [Candidatus Saccharibacteria bacterium]
MTLFALFFSFIFGLLFSFTSIPATQSNTRDTERKSDINQIHAKLEEYYIENGDYPTEEGLALNYDIKLPGLDPEALSDPNGMHMDGGDYSYRATECTALGCAHYVLTARLEDGKTYTKHSLN